MYNERRKFLCHGIGTSIIVSGFITTSKSHAAGVAVPWSNEELAGQILSGSHLNAAIEELNNQRSLISLANDKSLDAECRMVAEQAAQGIANAAALRDNLSGDLDTAQITLAISTISATVGVIGSIAFIFTTSPAWIVLGLGVGTASAAWSLTQFSDSEGTGRAIMGVSHFGGRFSVIGATELASGTAQTVGRCLSAIAALADLYTAVTSGIKIADVSERLNNVSNVLSETRQQYLAFSNNLASCRKTRLEEIDATISALEFVRDLGDISQSTGSVNLP